MKKYIERVVSDAYISENREKELEKVSIEKIQLIQMPGQNTNRVGSVNKDIILQIVLATGRTNNSLPDRVRRRIEYRLERNLRKHFPEIKFDRVLAVETAADYIVLEKYA